MFSLVTCGPFGIVWPIESVLHPANANDVVIFKQDLLTHLPKATKLLLADTGFDDERLANACDKRKITLVTPIPKVGKSTSKKRLARAALFATPDVREAFALRKTSVEPFQREQPASDPGPLGAALGSRQVLCCEQERANQGFVRVGTVADEGPGECSGVMQFGGGDVLLAGVVQRWVGSACSRIEGDDVFAGVTMHTPHLTSESLHKPKRQVDVQVATIIESNTASSYFVPVGTKNRASTLGALHEMIRKTCLAEELPPPVYTTVQRFVRRMIARDPIQATKLRDGLESAQKLEGRQGRLEPVWNRAARCFSTNCSNSLHRRTSRPSLRFDLSCLEFFLDSSGRESYF